MLPLTRGGAKELLEIGGIPLLVRVLEECTASGISETLIVISPDKTEIVDIIAPLAGSQGKPDRILFAIQSEPRGLADAIRLGRDFARGEPLAVALPDNLFAGADPGLKQVIDTHLATGKNVVSVVEIFAEDAMKRGPTSIFPGSLDNDEFIIERIPAKGERGRTFDTGGMSSAFTGVGRYVFMTDAFHAIDEVESVLEEGRELDDVPVMQNLLEKGRLTGRRILGEFFDVGLISGYEAATAEFGVTSTS